jgi:hypothetical protein
MESKKEKQKEYNFILDVLESAKRALEGIILASILFKK